LALFELHALLGPSDPAQTLEIDSNELYAVLARNALLIAASGAVFAKNASISENARAKRYPSSNRRYTNGVIF